MYYDTILQSDSAHKTFQNIAVYLKKSDRDFLKKNIRDQICEFRIENSEFIYTCRGKILIYE